ALQSSPLFRLQTLDGVIDGLTNDVANGVVHQPAAGLKPKSQRGSDPFSGTKVADENKREAPLRLVNLIDDQAAF
ncbi:MAG: hypothetical protein AAB881_01680, partial [Patescibacteria group bacterium]